VIRIVLTLLCVATALALGGRAAAQADVHCAAFTQDVIPAPEPREAKWAQHRFELINAEVRSVPHRVLFLGDSLIERFQTPDAPELWRKDMEPRGVLNAGVSGDRTEHLLWRLQHGNLVWPAPAGIVVLIGTNDLSYDRPPEIVAEGIRANLLYLRQKLPQARIGLLGLLPRDPSPEGRFRRGTLAVNRLIARCGGDAVVYADIGEVLLERDGQLSTAISPDHLHFSQAGYARLIPKLDELIDIVAPRR
jgi:lysophospholipase L1-like esterase